MRATALVMAVLGGLLVAACSASVTGTAQPAAGPSSAPAAGRTTPGSTPGYGAPKVTTPLDTAKFQPNPCTTMTSAQLSGIGVTVAGQLKTDDLGNSCLWSPVYDVVYGVGFNLRAQLGNARGLANVYENAGSGSMRRLPDVRGQPAVTEPYQNTGGFCVVYLGATDQIVYTASASIGPDQPHYDDPCTVADRIADDATATMKSEQSGP